MMTLQYLGQLLLPACLPATEKLHQQIANFPPLSLNSIMPSGKKQCVASIPRSHLWTREAV